MIGVIFDPLLPLWGIAVLAALSALAVLAAAWRGLRGWWLRGAAALVILAGLANPALRQQERAPLEDIVLIVTDASASARLGGRAAQTAAAQADLLAALAALPNIRVRQIDVADAPDDRGTLVMGALAQALREEPLAQIAGVFVISDGQVHDIAASPDLPAPLHLLQSGLPTDWDRRLIVQNAPAYAILGESFTLRLRVEDQGAAPPASMTDLAVSVDGAPPLIVQVPIGRDIDLPLQLSHAGRNVLHFSLPPVAGELTDRNNAAVVQINGLRERLRVLLVSGEPHAGQRTWRNLLKSDAAVDLVHFTILRPPEKQDGVPVDELALIAFPTRELFMEKIDAFDLIIFDRYRRRGILPDAYFANIRAYVENGGAVLVAAGPEYGGVDSLFRSPLGPALPAAPSAQILSGGYVPQITALGARHPVTAGLDAPYRDAAGPTWGPWLRQVDVRAQNSAQVLMSGLQDRPLLLLDRIGAGRVALIASDHAWLWDRGYQGGGPQGELLRRLAHWMMAEPELEEDALRALATGQQMRIIRRSVDAAVPDVTITHPDGQQTVLALDEVAPGRFEALWDAPEIGLYRISNGDLQTVVGLGPSAPREFEQTIASPDILAPEIAVNRGGVAAIADGAVSIRQLRQGARAAGRGWLGITPRGAYAARDIRTSALLPSWLMLLLAGGLIIAAWLREGRR